MTALAEASPGIDESGLRPARADWRLPASLVTKAIASGMFMIMAAIWLLGLAPFDRRTALVGNGLALFFLAITSVLLVADLERRERFLRILTRPQWKSWLTRGAFILIGFSLVSTLWFALELGAQLGWLPDGVATAARIPLMALGFPLALLTAIYTAFLFGQCEGRDLWHSSLMPWHMGVQAVMAGGAGWILLLAFSYLYLGSGGVDPKRWFAMVAVLAFLVAGLIDLLLRRAAVSDRHPTANGQQAASSLRHGSERQRWRRSLALSRLAIIGPLTYLGLDLAWYVAESNRLGHLEVDPRDRRDILFNQHMISWGMLGIFIAVAAILALIGLYLYNSAIIKSGEDVPNA